MRILFDHQVFAWQKFGGISRYHAELLRGLRTAGEDAMLPDGIYTENIHLQEIAGIPMHPFGPFDFQGKGHVQNLRGRPKTRWALAKTHPDIFHPTYYDPYFLPETERLGIPFVLTVHDMMHEIFEFRGGRFSLDAEVIEDKKLLAQKAAAIIAVSETTKRDLLHFYPEIPPEKVHVIWHGSSLKADLTAHFRLDLPEKYVLFVGNRGFYKNFAAFVAGVGPVVRGRADVSVVFAGAGPFSPGELRQLEAAGIVEQTQHVSVTDDRELGEIYRRACCFVFPSRYEGFGIPVLESFACGCPVLLNDAGSLPEAGGDAAVYFRESEPETLSDALKELLDAPERRAELRQKGFFQLQKFTWQKSVAGHLEVYRKVAASAAR